MNTLVVRSYIQLHATVSRVSESGEGHLWIQVFVLLNV